MPIESYDSYSRRGAGLNRFGIKSAKQNERRRVQPFGGTIPEAQQNMFQQLLSGYRGQRQPLARSNAGQPFTGGTSRRQATAPGITSPSTEWNQSRGRSMLGARNPEQDPTGFVFGGQAPNYEAILSAISSGSGDQYANQLSDLERRKGEAQSQIGFGSQALAEALAKSRGELDAQYAAALQSQQAGQQSAAQALATNAQATTDQNAELQRNLGITGGVDNSRSQADLLNAQSDLASLGQSGGDALRAQQLSQYTLGTRNMDAARTRGFEDQGASRRGYDSAIAQLLDEQNNSRNQAQQQAMSMYGQLMGQYNTDRDFAYDEWVRNEENSRQDARDQLNFENELRMSQASAEPEQLSPYEQLMGSLQVRDPGTARSWFQRVGRYNPRNPGTGFEDLWGNASPSNQAAIRQYLKSMGLLS